MIAPMAAIPPVKRKLAAILAADAVGYSRHMARDEEETMRILSAHRAVIDGIIEFHSGRIVGTAGDSVLAEFASPVEALRCAVEIQAALKTRNDSLAQEKRLAFRIGINLGDVMVKGNDLLGDGVNVAARLEGIADPGGICISSSVYDQIAGKLDLGFVEMGEKSLKNIDRPIRVYSVQAGASGSKPALRRRRSAPYVVAALLAFGAIAAGMWRLTGRGAEPALSQPSRRAAEEARIAAMRAHAEEEIAKARAQAQIEKARADAEALRLQAASELAAERKTARGTPAQGAPQPAAGNAVASGVAAALSAAHGDGNARRPAMQPRGAKVAFAASPWVAKLRCEAFRRFPPVRLRLPVRREDGAITLERGAPGRPGYLLMRGAPTGGGTLAFDGVVIPPGGRMRRAEIPARFRGRFESGTYRATGRLGQRPCTLEIGQRAR